MSLLLLAFGGVLSIAGILLVGFGVSIHDHTFDTSVITPGVVAAVGGLLLIGFGLALRVLQRIERALAARAAALRAEPALAAAPAHAERLAPSNPPILASHPQPASVATVAPAAPGNPAEEPAAKTPLIARLEATRVIAEAEAPHSPNPTMPFPTSVDIAVAQVGQVQAARRKNGAGTLRTAPRLDVAPRAPVASERTAGPFDSLWPKTERAARPGQPASTPAPSALPQTKAEPDGLAPEPAAAPETPAGALEAEAVSVLKSGVVDGMGYTLFSDGSIEAQLPQGTLRFGSIAELRNHIERSA